MKGRHHSATDTGPLRLHHTHRRLWNRRWDESLQMHIDDATSETTPWEDAAQCRQCWMYSCGTQVWQLLAKHKEGL